METFYWIFIIIFLFILIIAFSFSIQKVDRRKKPVSQWTKSGHFVANFNSITEASIYTNTPVTGISRCCRGIQKTSGGYIWKYGNYEIVTENE